MAMSTLLLLTFAAFAAATGQLLFKIGATGSVAPIDFINWPIFFGLLFYACGTAIWIYALSSQLLVNVYAFTALTFVLVYIGGVFLLGEELSRPAITGVLLILLGLYLITKNAT